MADNVIPVIPLPYIVNIRVCPHPFGNTDFGIHAQLNRRFLMGIGMVWFLIQDRDVVQTVGVKDFSPLRFAPHHPQSKLSHAHDSASQQTHPISHGKNDLVSPANIPRQSDQHGSTPFPHPQFHRIYIDTCMYILLGNKHLPVHNRILVNGLNDGDVCGNWKKSFHDQVTCSYWDWVVG